MLAERQRCYLRKKKCAVDLQTKRLVSPSWFVQPPIDVLTEKVSDTQCPQTKWNQHAFVIMSGTSRQQFRE